MKIEILVGTNRKGSRSKGLADWVQTQWAKKGVESQVIDLSDIDFAELNSHLYGGENRPTSMEPLVKRVNQADGLYVVCPEYNGSYPGVVKAFIDYWDYPNSFEKLPVCFTGMGGLFGGLRPVEHLQQVFGYRNAFVYPERVFLQNVWSVLGGKGEPVEDKVKGVLEKQLENFPIFIQALKSSGLHKLS